MDSAKKKDRLGPDGLKSSLIEDFLLKNDYLLVFLLNSGIF